LGRKDSKIKITFSTVQDRIAVLHNKYKFRNEKNPASVKQIYINPDFTPLEQRKSRGLIRQQLAE